MYNRLGPMYSVHLTFSSRYKYESPWYFVCFDLSADNLWQKVVKRICSLRCKLCTHVYERYYIVPVN